MRIASAEGTNHIRSMRSLFAATLILLPAAGVTQPIRPGAWDVTSKVVVLSVPGLPDFLARMARGKAKAEHKRVTAGQGIEAVLAPDPKARCRIDSQTIGDGRYAQTLTCPQKRGGPMQVVRTGTYDTTGFTGRATVAGTTPKGPLHIVLEQRAMWVGG